MEEYLFFVDETLKTSTNPFFSMGGIAIKRNYYEDTFTVAINELKKRHFETTDVIFHYSDMNNKKGKFEKFKDAEVRENFWRDYVATVRNLDFVCMGVYFDQKKMDKLYASKQIKIYNIAFSELLKSFISYMKEVKGKGSICIESRSLNENAELQRIYYNYLVNGSIYYSKDDFEKYLSSIGFVVKGDNSVGLQIADIVPSALLREVNSRKDSFEIGKMYRTKLYKNNTEYENSLGFKDIL